MYGETIGYTYQAENLCPSCTLKAMRANGIKVQRGKPHEVAVRRAAQNLGIDYDDLYSYDSGNFPKPVSEQMCETELDEIPGAAPGVRHTISDERCSGVGCGKWLVLGEKSPTEAGLIRWVRDEYELPQALAREVAGTLREWGLSHPEFIDADNVKDAAARHPHAWTGYRFVNYPASKAIELITEPDYPTEECMYCGGQFDAHQAQPV